MAWPKTLRLLLNYKLRKQQWNHIRRNSTHPNKPFADPLANFTRSTPRAHSQTSGATFAPAPFPRASSA